MPIYRGSIGLIYAPLVVILYMFGSKSHTLYISLFAFMAISLSMVLFEVLLGGLKMKGCIKYLFRPGIEIHVADEAKGDSELYLNLVSSKIHKALSLNQPAYIVAHSQSEVELLKSIPGVDPNSTANWFVKLTHHMGVSVYSKVPGKRQDLHFIRRFKDVKRRWSYGCYYFKIPVSQEAITHLQSTDRIIDVKKISISEIVLIIVMLAMWPLLYLFVI